VAPVGVVVNAPLRCPQIHRLDLFVTRWPFHLRRSKKTKTLSLNSDPPAVSKVVDTLQTGVEQIFRCLSRLPRPLTPLCLSIILFGSRFADLVCLPRGAAPVCHTANIWGTLIESHTKWNCQRRSGDPTWVMLQSLNKGQASVPQNYRHPARDRLGSLMTRAQPLPVWRRVSRKPELAKLIREAKVRSINIGRTRLIEKAADVRRMATAGAMTQTDYGRQT